MNEVLSTFHQRVDAARAKLQEIDALVQAAAPASSLVSTPIRIVGASKAQSVESMRAFAQAGLKRFGENYLQEALAKKAALADEDIEWHFIGRIQSNKAKQVATNFDWVQTIDSLRLAQRLSHFRELSHPGDPINCCVQVNIDKEPQKGGVDPMEAPALVSEIGSLPGLRLRGLMAIPAALRSQALQKDAFNHIRKIFDEAKPLQPEFWDTLSIGMSGDYRLAISLHSNMVRLGTALFGPRT